MRRRKHTALPLIGAHGLLTTVRKPRSGPQFYGAGEWRINGARFDGVTEVAIVRVSGRVGA